MSRWQGEYVLSENGWARLFPEPRYYGWAIVGMGFLCSALSSPGQSFALSLYLESVMADLRLSRMELSSLYAVATLLAATCLPFVGAWADRMRSGWFLAGVVALLGGAMFGLSAVQGAAGLGIAFFFLRLLGQGAIGLGTLTATVQWFFHYRGRALALVGLGYAFGQMVFPAMIYGLIERVGWRGSLVALGLLYLVVFAPLIGRLMRDRRASDQSRTHPVGGAALGPAELSYPLREVLRMPVFWGILVCLSVPPLVSTAVVFHQVALFGSLEWSASLVPAAFMAFAIGNVVMTYCTGLLLERVPARVGVSGSLGLSVLAFGSLLLPLSPWAGSLLYGTLLGFAAGAEKAASSIVWPEYFGTAALGAVKGVVNAVGNGASAIGPPVAAALMSATGSFTGALVIFSLMSATAALYAILLRPPGVVLPGDHAGSGDDSALVPQRRAGQAA